MQPCDDVLMVALYIITYVCAFYCIKKGKSVELRRERCGERNSVELRRERYEEGNSVD